MIFFVKYIEHSRIDNHCNARKRVYYLGALNDFLDRAESDVHSVRLRLFWRHTFSPLVLVESFQRLTYSHQ